MLSTDGELETQFQRFPLIDRVLIMPVTDLPLLRERDRGEVRGTGDLQELD